MAAKKFMAKALSMFLILCVLTATDPVWAQNLGEIARQERVRRATQSGPTRVITNEDLQRDKILEPLMPEDRTVVRIQLRQQPGRVLVMEPETPSIAVRLPDAMLAKALAPYTNAMAAMLFYTGESAKVALAQRPAKVAPVTKQQGASSVSEPAPPATVIPWPAFMSLGDVARYYQSQKQAPAYQEVSPKVFFTARTPERTMIPARQLPLTVMEPATPSGMVRSLAGSSLGDVARFYQDRKDIPEYRVPEAKVTLQERQPKQILATTRPMPKKEAEPEALSNVIRWPTATPLGDVARYYQSLQDIPEFQEPVVEEAEVTEVQNSMVVETAPAMPLASIRKEFLQNLPKLEVVETAGIWVRVERGDSLWKLAQKYLGDGKAWQQIAEANPQITNPNHILAGESLRMPMKPQITEDRDAQSVRVQSGDSLWKLAAARFGNGQAWLCIVAANPEIGNASLIRPGQVLILPTSCDSSN